MKNGLKPILLTFALTAVVFSGCAKDVSQPAPAAKPGTIQAPATVQKADSTSAPYGSDAKITESIKMYSRLPDMNMDEAKQSTIPFNIGLKAEGETSYLPVLTTAIPKPKHSHLTYDEIVLDLDQMYSDNLQVTGKDGKAIPKARLTILTKARKAAIEQFSDLIKKIVNCVNDNPLLNEGAFLSCSRDTSKDLDKALKSIQKFDLKAEKGLSISEFFGTKVNEKEIVGLSKNDFLKELGISGVNCVYGRVPKSKIWLLDACRVVLINNH